MVLEDRGQAGFEGIMKIDGTEVDIVQDTDINMTRDEIEDTARDTGSFKSFINGLGEWSIDFTIIWKRGKAIMDVIETAFLNGEILENVDILDKDGFGFNGDFSITNYSTGQPLQGAVTTNVTFKGRGAPTKATGTS